MNIPYRIKLLIFTLVFIFSSSLIFFSSSTVYAVPAGLSVFVQREFDSANLDNVDIEMRCDTGSWQSVGSASNGFLSITASPASTALLASSNSCSDGSVVDVRATLDGYVTHEIDSVFTINFSSPQPVNDLIDWFTFNFPSIHFTGSDALLFSHSITVTDSDTNLPITNAAIDAGSDICIEQGSGVYLCPITLSNDDSTVNVSATGYTPGKVNTGDRAFNTEAQLNDSGKLTLAPIPEYWYNSGSDANWSTLSGNWWDDPAHTQQSTGLPSSTTPVITVGEVGPNVDLDSWTQPASIDASATGITFNSLNSSSISIDITGDAVFNGTSINNGTITGNATFNNDLSVNLGMVSGMKIRRYTSNIVKTSDFVTGGPWTIMADGAIVEIDGATVDMNPVSPTYTLLLAINGGSFVYAPPTINISSCADFKSINNILSWNYTLTTNLDCHLDGNSMMVAINNPFTGMFNGGGHTITIAFSDPSGTFDMLGLFNKTSGATLKNITVAGVIDGPFEMAALVDDANNTHIDNAHANVDITVDENNNANPYVGGLIAQLSNNSILENSSASGSITGYDSTLFLGGLIGVSQDTLIKKSYAINNIISHTTNLGCGVGGFIGCALNGTTIDHSFSTGLVSHFVNIYGGFIGEDDGGNNYNYNFYDQNTSEQANCKPGGDVAGCVGVDTISVPNENYFNGNSSNPPLDEQWDFSTVPIWDIAVGHLPILHAISTNQKYSLAPSLLSPIPSRTYSNANPFYINFTLPEVMLSGSLSLTFTPIMGNPIVLHLKDAESVRENPFHFIPSNLVGVDEIISVSDGATSIPNGTYTVTLSYLNTFGDKAGTTTLKNIVIADPSGIPALSAIIPITSNTKATDAVYNFSNTGSEGTYEFTQLTQSIGNTAEVHMDSINHNVTFTGLQVGGTYSTSFKFVDSDHNISNTLFIGPFTVLPSNNENIPSAIVRSGGHPTYNFISSSSDSSNNIKLSSPIKSVKTSGTNIFTFTHVIKKNDTDPDVKKLQKFLNSRGFKISKTGVGSPGHETTVFSTKTSIALSKFQKANKIPATGFFGPLTLKLVNSLITAGK